MKILQSLNLTAYLPEDRENSEIDVAMWHSDENICALKDDAAVTQFDGTDCITKHGIYFGTSDSREPKFCPAHYFGDLGYTIEESGRCSIRCNNCFGGFNEENLVPIGDMRVCPTCKTDKYLMDL